MKYVKVTSRLELHMMFTQSNVQSEVYYRKKSVSEMKKENNFSFVLCMVSRIRFFFYLFLYIHGQKASFLNELLWNVFLFPFVRCVYELGMQPLCLFCSIGAKKKLNEKNNIIVINSM